MKKIIINNHIGIVFMIFSAALLIKIGVFRYMVFGEVSFLKLFIVEFPAWMLVPSLLFFAAKKVTPGIVLGYHFFLSALIVSIIWYERYFNMVPSYYDLNQAHQAGSVMETVTLLYSHWDLLFFVDLFLYVLLMVKFRKMDFKTSRRLKIGLVLSVVMLATGATTYAAFQKPIIDITLYAKEQGYIQTQLVQALLQNTSAGHAESALMSPSELEALKGNTFVPYTEHERFGVAEGRHLFFIQVESLQALAIDQTVGNQEITPNINALLSDSIYFNQIFQQIGGGNTSDAEWIFHTSLYPKGLEPTVNYLDGSEVPSFVRSLNDEDYLTSTYHADSIDYWNRKYLYPALGFQNIFTKEEIPYKEVIGFGPSDQVLFDFVIQETQKQIAEGEKIYANILTLTSHTPFEMPADKEFLELPEEFKGSYAGNYLQSVRYTDEQIGKFVEFLKKENIYQDSLIVITGDHSGLHGTPMKKSDSELLSGMLGHTYTIKDRFLLPFVVVGPGLFNNERDSRLGGQLDIMPTLMNLLGIVPENPIIGHDLLTYPNNLVTMRYYLPGGSFVTGKEIYLGQNARYPERYYDFDMMVKFKPIPRIADQHQQTIKEILDYSDAILNNYITKNANN